VPIFSVKKTKTKQTKKMGLFDILELTLSYIQYIVLILGAEPSPFPEFFSSPLLVLNAINLDINEFIDKIKDPLETAEIRSAIPASLPLDLRFQFVLVAILAPMFYSTISLLFLSPGPFVIWFLTVLLSVFLIVSGSLFNILPTPLIQSQSNEGFYNGVLVTGVVILFVALAYGLYYLFTSAIRRKKIVRKSHHAKRDPSKASGKQDDDYTYVLMWQEPISKHLTVDEIMFDSVKNFDYLGQSIRLLYIVISLVFGLASLQVFEIPILPFFGKLGYASVALGIIILTFAGGSFFWFLASSFCSKCSFMALDSRRHSSVCACRILHRSNSQLC
jgi:hypothetical protein